MQRNPTEPQETVADRLRPVAFLYIAINIAVVALLVSTVSSTLAVTAPAEEMASLR